MKARDIWARNDEAAIVNYDVERKGGSEGEQTRKTGRDRQRERERERGKAERCRVSMKGKLGRLLPEQQSRGTRNPVQDGGIREGDEEGEGRVLYGENAVCLIIRHLAMARSIALRLMDLHR